MTGHKLTDWLPTTLKEVRLRGWDQLDVILFSGDAYVDHPSFGAAVIGRVLEAEGLKVAIVPQPNWQDDLRDFRKLGRPRLFFGITAGAMDSMVNRYTANRRIRHDDAYTPGGRAGQRPDYPTIVYAGILKRLWPDVPVIVGGIEASMRRLSHYDYWQDRLRPGILADCPADLLIYGMGEKPIREIARRMRQMPAGQVPHDVPQTACLLKDAGRHEGDLVLHSYGECLADRRKQALNFRRIEEESNCPQAARLLQETGGRWMAVNAPYPPLSTEELDAVYALPYTRLPHPKYNGKRIPAFEMIQFSVTLHRGCFGGCAFCTISAHQGKAVVSRSKQSVIEEVRRVTEMPGFKGYISDLGGPSANMYGMHPLRQEPCRRCKRPSCIHPQPCPNLCTDHRPLLDLYREADAQPGVKKSFIGSGVRYDLLLCRSGHPGWDEARREYARQLITRHVSGRLKVAPEHTSPAVLQLMRKPGFSQFRCFKQLFDEICQEAGLRQQIVPYFISSHPGCTDEDMAALAVETKDLRFRLEQVQDFTPTPMTLSTEMYYTGFDPYTLQPVQCARTPQQKLRQRMFFFWYLPENRRAILDVLRRLGRADLAGRLYGRHR